MKENSSSKGIPSGITHENILAAIDDLSMGIPHAFGQSTGYDVLYQGKRFAPKAVVGLAAGKLTGTALGPYDFKGGLNTLCFRVLQENGFEIVLKPDVQSFPEEVDAGEVYLEGSISRVMVNRYERDSKARSEALFHYGSSCQVCAFDFALRFGQIGSGFIHIHHIVPLAAIGTEYVLDPIKDLRPVCPNCHAMLHRKTPPYTIDELRRVVQFSASNSDKPA